MRSLTTLSALSRTATSVLRSTTCRESFERSIPFRARQPSLISQCEGFAILRRQVLPPCTGTALSKPSSVTPQPLPTGGALRSLSTTQPLCDLKKQGHEDPTSVVTVEEKAFMEGFKKSEKASKAAQVNLSARLRKEGPNISGKAGLGEIIRLVKIAKPESKWLSGMFYAVRAKIGKVLTNWAYRRFCALTVLFRCDHVRSVSSPAGHYSR